jgi:hypothetical protein
MRRLAIVLAALTLGAGPSSLGLCGTEAGAAARGYSCCKVCSKGKACGDSCIARDKTCHKGKGCACDG